MDLGYVGKRCLVTASTGGLGFAIARHMADEGATVFVNGRTASSLEAAAKRIRSAVKDAKPRLEVGLFRGSPLRDEWTLVLRRDSTARLFVTERRRLGARGFHGSATSRERTQRYERTDEPFDLHVRRNLAKTTLTIA